MNKTKIHIEGMGVVGSMIARHLAAADVSFTWHDIDANVNAHQASTGCVYPSGDLHQQRNYENWLSFARYQHPHPKLKAISDLTETADFWFLSKSPPHQSPDKVVEKRFGLRIGEMPSVHLNVQNFVERTQAAFVSNRTDRLNPEADWFVRSHGYGNDLDKYIWGYSAVVEVNAKAFEVERQVQRRPSFYLRDGKYVIHYLFPIPQSVLYYAGSSLIAQKRSAPKRLEIQTKFDKLVSHVELRTGGRIQISTPYCFREGWRPKPQVFDPNALISRHGRELRVVPLSHSGVSYSIEVAKQILSIIGE